MDNLVKSGSDGGIRYKVYTAECKNTSLSNNSFTIDFDGSVTMILAIFHAADNQDPTVTLNGGTISYTRKVGAGYYRDFYEYTIPVRKGDVLNYYDTNSVSYTLVVLGILGYLQNLSFLNDRSSKITATTTQTNRYILAFTNAVGSTAIANCSYSCSGGKEIRLLDATDDNQKGMIYLIDANDDTATVTLSSGGSTYGTVALYVF